MTTATITPVELSKAFRLINHGPTTLVSARYDGVDNVMAASWVCAWILPPKTDRGSGQNDPYPRIDRKKAGNLLFKFRQLPK